MSASYVIEVSITPLCTSCGKELQIGMAESRPTGHTFERDCPEERTHQRVFVYACADCFVFKSDLAAKVDEA